MHLSERYPNGVGPKLSAVIDQIKPGCYLAAAPVGLVEDDPGAEGLACDRSPGLKPGGAEGLRPCTSSRFFLRPTSGSHSSEGHVHRQARPPARRSRRSCRDPIRSLAERGGERHSGPARGKVVITFRDATAGWCLCRSTDRAPKVFRSQGRVPRRRRRRDKLGRRIPQFARKSGPPDEHGGGRIRTCDCSDRERS